MKKSKLFVLTGASGSGKTTLLNDVISNFSEPSEGHNILFKLANKYSSRKRRDANDDIISNPNIKLPEFDLVYKLNKKTYGIKIKEIILNLDAGNNLGIILSDLRVIHRLRQVLQDRLVVIYISSAVDSHKLEKIQDDRYGDKFSLSKEENKILHKQFLQLQSASRLGRYDLLFTCMRNLSRTWKKYIPEQESTEIRINKIRDFHKTYIDKISTFDHVILNYREGDTKPMLDQFKNILMHEIDSIDQRKVSYPPVFIVSAASGSGKGMLMETVSDVIGEQALVKVPKFGKRNNKPNDRRDGMTALGKKGDFPIGVDITWRFHKGEFYEGTEYGVSSHVIQQNIKKQIPQIFVSNLQQIDRFLDLYPNNAVIIYLHRLTSIEELEKYQIENCETQEEAKQRITDIEKVYDDYVLKCNKVDHVLLNTTFPEDLYEQVFSLLSHYQKK